MYYIFLFYLLFIWHIATMIFGNSSFKEGKSIGFLSLRWCLLHSSLKLAHGVFLLVVTNMLSYFVTSSSKISKHQCSNQTLCEHTSQNTLEWKLASFILNYVYSHLQLLTGAKLEGANVLQGDATKGLGQFIYWGLYG
jgi:hypothetical protein